MTTQTLARVAALGLAATLALGCDEKPATPAGTTDGGMRSAAADPTVPPMMSDAKDRAAGAMGAATTQMDAMGATATGAGDSMMAQAQKVYDDAKAAINKADFNGAQKYVDQLTAMKSKLSPEWQAKVTDLEKMLADGRSKLGGMTMPKMGQ